MSNTEPGESALGFAAARELQSNFKQVEELMVGLAKSYEGMNLDPLNLKKVYTDWWAALSADPQKIIQANLEFWQKSFMLSQQAMLSLMGQKAEPVITPEKTDRRFSHEDWMEKPAFDMIKQSYLLTSQWMRNLVTDVEGLDEHTAERVKFFTERMLDAASPTNFALTNPAVLEKIKETKGANLVHGLKNMLEDLEAGKGELRIRMTDTSAFKLGENVAVTPGKIVFQNRMFQLIQYTPTTEKVLKRPLLVVPPWINKFYIMDLQPKNSLLKWLVEQGHTVYVMSWVNPDETYANVGFEEYVTNGVIKALDAIEYDTGETKVNTIGYCIGGTLLTSTLAYLKSKGDNRIASSTFFTTMLDFSNPGELGLFIDEEQIKGLESKMNEKGFLEGSNMAGTFNLMRANDLIWSFYVNNYLLGNDPRPFDLLYWNSDSTRMPAKMHSWYLRNLYLQNDLCKPKVLSIDGVPLDITSIDVPACFVSAIEDHIAPWVSTYSGAKLFSGDVTFILGGSGHIAGIINPPNANKYGYRVGDNSAPDAKTWLEQHAVKTGSWWPEWDRWVKALDSTMVPARQPGANKLKAIEDAPGTYVKVRLDEPTPVVEYTQLEAKPAKKAAAKAEPAKKAAPKAETKAEAKPAAKKAPAKAAETKPAAKKAAPKADKPAPATAVKPVTAESTPVQAVVNTAPEAAPLELTSAPAPVVPEPAAPAPVTFEQVAPVSETPSAPADNIAPVVLDTNNPTQTS
ncbi:PHA/PHB synthase family protein [Thiofilum flexile]|uniref:PHA/PHB synthase family protein n=1 Tax=Thiofilum flexile TaxID=125627 RepID=UPI00035F68FB|nr:class I poly(R)-hydroxyalkanoic acid synthase [Thiofilum flexile]